MFIKISSIVILATSSLSSMEHCVECPACKTRFHVLAPENSEERLRQLQIKKLEQEFADREAQQKKERAQEEARRRQEEDEEAYYYSAHP